MEAFRQEEGSGRRLSAAWLLLAVAAFGLSTLFAVLLVVARMPMLGAAAPGDMFRSALVLHVGLAVVVWFLCCAAGFWTMTLRRTAAVDGLAFAAALIGVVAMTAAPMFGASKPVLANYLPVLDSPVYLAGLASFLAGIAASALLALGRLLLKVGHLPKSTQHVAAALPAFAVVMALGLLVVTLLQHGLPGEAGRFEIIGWGPGHVLQFVHVLLMMWAWSVLAAPIPGFETWNKRWLPWLLLAAAVPLLTVPFIYAAYPADSVAYRRAFTLLMAWESWPAPVLMGVRVLVQLHFAGSAVRRTPQSVVLLLSIGLFMLGCLVGAAIRVDSTMVPEHYHGTVGAVTLAYMALGYRLLPVFGLPQPTGRLARWQPLMYGFGLVVLVAGLAWSGWMGVPRKTPHADIVAQYPAYYVAMGMAMLGGALAVAGAALFVVNMLRSVCPAWQPRPLRWMRGTIAGLVAAVGLFACQPARVDQQPVISAEAAAHAAEKRKEEIDRHFAEGAARLAAKEFEAAAGHFHRVLELAPRMPEAHVNFGYAMIGMRRYAVARDFFDTAIELRPNQTNAYYGLALALEGLNDYGGALGAMRSYVHLSKGDDPFVRKANSAIWEWEEALKRARASMHISAKALPENGNGDPSTPIHEKTPG